MESRLYVKRLVRFSIKIFMEHYLIYYQAPDACVPGPWLESVSRDALANQQNRQRACQEVNLAGVS